MVKTAQTPIGSALQNCAMAMGKARSTNVKCHITGMTNAINCTVQHKYSMLSVQYINTSRNQAGNIYFMNRFQDSFKSQKVKTILLRNQNPMTPPYSAPSFTSIMSQQHSIDCSTTMLTVFLATSLNLQLYRCLTI